MISNQIQYNEHDFFQIWHQFDCHDFVGQEKLYRSTLISSISLQIYVPCPHEAHFAVIMDKGDTNHNKILLYL